MSFCSELRQFLKSWKIDLRLKRDYPNLVDADAADAIVDDIEGQQRAVAQKAYTAEQADREAIDLLEKAKKGGLDNSDLPLLERAIRNIRRSADGDRQISEVLAP